MLIQALCNYYDHLAQNGKIAPNGYSFQNVHYLICLTPDGRVDDILDWQLTVETETKNGKTKPKAIPRSIVLPLRTEKSGIESNIIEHRPLYIFGLNLDDNAFTPDDRTDKARKSHDAFRNANLAFTEGMDSPIVNAYRNFLLNWNPDAETENVCLKALGKAYKSAYFAFCLSGAPDVLLHEDKQVLQRWEEKRKANSENQEIILAQCAILESERPIARIHKKLTGFPKGNSTGCSLVSFNVDCGCSYNKTQSFNSNISYTAMNQYTFALDYLLHSQKHHATIDDLTFMYWAQGSKDSEAAEDWFNAFMKGDDEAAEQDYLDTVMQQSKQLAVSPEALNIAHANADTDFFILGLKPADARLSVKLFYRRKFGEVFENIASFQKDMQIGAAGRAVSLNRIALELTSPKAGKNYVYPALISDLLHAVLYNGTLPESIASTVIRRFRTDRTRDKSNRYTPNEAIRAGLLKAYINRKYQREEIKMALDKTNTNPHYLCGRLFAVLERIQEQSQGFSEDSKTIRDSYFSAAAATPDVVFPNLIKKAQYHLGKLEPKNERFFSRLTAEIIDGLDTAFPKYASLEDQGKFMIGYYQQKQALFVRTKKNEEEQENGTL